MTEITRLGRQTIQIRSALPGPKDDERAVMHVGHGQSYAEEPPIERFDVAPGHHAPFQSTFQPLLISSSSVPDWWKQASLMAEPMPAHVI